MKTQAKIAKKPARHAKAHSGSARTHSTNVEKRHHLGNAQLGDCDAYKAERIRLAGNDVNSLSWGVKTLAEPNITGFVRNLKRDFPPGGLFEGREGEYVNIVAKYNRKKGQRGDHVGDCIAYPIGWKDPNIGSIEDELALLGSEEGSDLRADLVATIYAEQANATSTEQRAYILYSILLRVKSERFPPHIKDVLDPQKYHGKKPVSEAESTYQRNYLPALRTLRGQKTNKPVSLDTLKEIEALIAGKIEIPADAGPYYFHWGANTTIAESEFQRVMKAESKNRTKEEASDIAERKGAFKHAKESRLGATMQGITEEMGWLKKIPGLNAGKENERINSMYIYR